jgi:hypothetical protein
MDAHPETAALINDLAIPHRAKAAYRRITVLGRDAVAAVEAGLGHENPDVWFFCTLALDKLAGTDSFPMMLPLLDDPDARVRSRALHALACDHCKADDVCLLDKTTILPIALRLLRDDSDAHVRALAVEVAAKWVHTDRTAEEALLLASNRDSSPAVRKKASWFAPGGPIYLRTKPKRPRVDRNAVPIAERWNPDTMCP